MKPFYGSQLKLGVLGGGQLGRMLIQEAVNLDVHVSILDPAEDAPCSELCNRFVQGSFSDAETVYRFGEGLDLITVEIEHVSVEALEALKREGKQVYPDPEILKVVQDKGLQKQFYRLNSIPTAPYYLAEDEEEIRDRSAGQSFVQKLRKGGYDGRGVKVVKSKTDLDDLLKGASVVEELADIDKEISVIVARNAKGELAVYPPVEMVFNDANLVDQLQSPAIISPEKEKEAMDLASRLAKAFKLVGILAVEMFLNKNGEIWVNEVAPRPHNSGHQSIEGNITSQYMQHLRAILGLPLGSTEILRPSIMINVLGAEGYSGKVYYEGLEEVLSTPDAHLHLYGKTETKPNRKMGHLTVLADTLEEAMHKAARLKSAIRVISR